jgi:molybdate transport system substrate-binding protein
METAERAGAIVPGSARVILRNALVVVVPADAAWTPADASELAHARVRRLALADPAVVPAGVYARRWLEGLGLWSAVSERVVPLENVRAALAAVASGNAEIGVVYVTDAASTDRVRVAFRIPAGEAPPVVYPAAVVARSRDREVAAEFVEHLRAPEAQAVFARHGFLPPEPAP